MAKHLSTLSFCEKRLSIKVENLFWDQIQKCQRGKEKKRKRISWHQVNYHPSYTKKISLGWKEKGKEKSCEL